MSILRRDLGMANLKQRFMGGFNLQDLMSKAKSQYDSLQKKDAGDRCRSHVRRRHGHRQNGRSQAAPQPAHRSRSREVRRRRNAARSVLAAVNEAARKVDAQMQSTVGGMLGGLGIPGL